MHLEEMANSGRLQCLPLCFVLCCSFACCDVIPAEIDAFMPIGPNSQRDSSGSVIINANTDANFLLVGRNFSSATAVLFTVESSDRGRQCQSLGQLTTSFSVQPYKNSSYRAIVKINLTVPKEGYYYICVNDQVDNRESWIHQGNDVFLRFTIAQTSSSSSPFLPLWARILIIVFLLGLSGLFSGLNLGLLSLDITELKIIANCGTPSEKEYANVITPLRKKGNFLLCTLLLGNVLVNNTLTILLDDIFNGLIAIIGSTAFIVVFGEIVPQAICSRYGLVVGAKTRFITYFFMMLTFPLSFPISLLLDKILGEEIGQVYCREKLQELIRLTKDLSVLDEDEMNIISGALTLNKKTVNDIMTIIDDVYMLDYDAVLNFETMSDIMRRGYSRIPVYEHDKSNIVALLNIKDLALIDPDDNTPLKTVCKFYRHHLIFVFGDHRLDQMLQDFRQGHSHMAIVRSVQKDLPGDPIYETMGVVTLEDVIEEIIQSEIMDETDTLSNNKKCPRMLPHRDFSGFNQADDDKKQLLPPQLFVAAFQFLSTSVEPFTEQFISDNVLKKLLTQNIVVEINAEHAKNKFIYKDGVPCDYFVLVLQGYVLVTIGKEKLIFQGGPFSYYGVNALNVNDNVLSSTDSINIKHEPFVPDFTVVPADNLLCLQIKWAHYVVARKATLMVRARQGSLKEDEAFKKEWTNLSKIESSNEIIYDTITEHYKLMNTGSATDAHTVNAETMSSLSPNTNVKDLTKTTDNRDAGWSFPSLIENLENYLNLEENFTKSSEKLTSTSNGRTSNEGKGPDCVTSEDLVSDGELKTQSDGYLYVPSLKSCETAMVTDDDRTCLIQEHQSTCEPKMGF